MSVEVILALERLLALVTDMRSQVLMDAINMQHELFHFLELFLAVRTLVDAIFFFVQGRLAHALALL